MTRVQVTAADIVSGDPWEPRECALARAIQRATGDEGAQVGELPCADACGLDKLCTEVNGEWARLPDVATDAANRLLDGKPVEPFEFDLPGVWQELAEITGGERGLPPRRPRSEAEGGFR